MDQWFLLGKLKSGRGVKMTDEEQYMEEQYLKYMEEEYERYMEEEYEKYMEEQRWLMTGVMEL